MESLLRRSRAPIPGPKKILLDNAALAFGLDDRQLAFATSEAAVLWDLENGRELRSWSLPRGLAQALCFDPKGHLLHYQWEKRNGDPAGQGKVRDLFGRDYKVLFPLAYSDSGPPEDVRASLSSAGDFLVIVGSVTNLSYPIKVFDPLPVGNYPDCRVRKKSNHVSFDGVHKLRDSDHYLPGTWMLHWPEPAT